MAHPNEEILLDGNLTRPEGLEKHVQDKDDCESANHSREECSGDSEANHTDFRHDLSRSDPESQKILVAMCRNQCMIVFGKEESDKLFWSVWECKLGDKAWFRQKYCLPPPGQSGQIRAEFGKITKKSADLCMTGICQWGYSVEFRSCRTTPYWKESLGPKVGLGYVTQNFTMQDRGTNGAFQIRLNCPGDMELCVDMSDKNFTTSHLAQSWHCKGVHQGLPEAELFADEELRRSITRRDKEDLAQMSVKSRSTRDGCNVKPVDKDLNGGLRTFEATCPVLAEADPLNLQLTLPPGQRQRLQNSTSSWLLWCSKSGCVCSQVDPQSLASVERGDRQVACGVLLVQAQPVPRQCPAELLDLNKTIGGRPDCEGLLSRSTKLQGQQEAERRFEVRLLQVNMEGLHEEDIRDFQGYTLTNTSGSCAVTADVMQNPNPQKDSMDELKVACEAGEEGAGMQLAVRRKDGQTDPPRHGTVWVLTCLRQASGDTSLCTCKRADLGEELFLTKVKLRRGDQGCGAMMLSTRHRFDDCPDHLKHLKESIEKDGDLDCAAGRREAAKMASDPTAQPLVRAKWVEMGRDEPQLAKLTKKFVSIFVWSGWVMALSCSAGWPMLLKSQQFMLMLSSHSDAYDLPDELHEFANKFTKVDGMVHFLKDAFGDLGGLVSWARQIIRYMSPFRWLQDPQRLHQNALQDCIEKHLFHDLQACLMKHYWDPERETLGDVAETLKQNGGEDPCSDFHHQDPKDDIKTRLEDGGEKGWRIRQSWEWVERTQKESLRNYKQVLKNSKAESVTMVVMYFFPILPGFLMFLALRSLLMHCRGVQAASEKPHLQFSVAAPFLIEVTMMPIFMGFMRVVADRHRLGCKNPFVRLNQTLQSEKSAFLEFIARTLRPPVRVLAKIPDIELSLIDSQIVASLLLLVYVVYLLLFWFSEPWWSGLRRHKEANHFMDPTCKSVKWTMPFLGWFYRESEGTAEIEGGVRTKDGGSPVYNGDGSLFEAERKPPEDLRRVDIRGSNLVLEVANPELLSPNGMCSEATLVLQPAPGADFSGITPEVHLDHQRGTPIIVVSFEVRTVEPIIPKDSEWQELLKSVWAKFLKTETGASDLFWETWECQPNHAKVSFALGYTAEEVPGAAAAEHRSEDVKARLNKDTCWAMLGWCINETSRVSQLTGLRLERADTSSPDQVGPLLKKQAEKAATEAERTQAQLTDIRVDVRGTEVKSGMGLSFLSLSSIWANLTSRINKHLGNAGPNPPVAGLGAPVTENSFHVSVEPTSTGREWKQLQVKRLSKDPSPSGADPLPSWTLSDLSNKVKCGDRVRLHVEGVPASLCAGARLEWPPVKPWKALIDPYEQVQADVKTFKKEEMEKQPEACIGTWNKSARLSGGQPVDLGIEVTVLLLNILCKDGNSLRLDFPRRNLVQPFLKLYLSLFPDDRSSDWSPRSRKLCYLVLCFMKPLFVESGPLWKPYTITKKAVAAVNATQHNMTDNISENITGNFTDNHTEGNYSIVDTDWVWTGLGCQLVKAADSMEARLIIIVIMLVVLVCPVVPLACIDGESWVMSDLGWKDWRDTAFRNVCGFATSFCENVRNSVISFHRDVQAVWAVGHRLEMMTTVVKITNVSCSKFGDPSMKGPLTDGTQKAIEAGCLSEAITAEIEEPLYDHTDDTTVFAKDTTLFAKVQSVHRVLPTTFGGKSVTLTRVEDPMPGCWPTPQTDVYCDVADRAGLAEMRAVWNYTDPTEDAVSIYLCKFDVEGPVSAHQGATLDLQHQGIEVTKTNALMRVRHPRALSLDLQRLEEILSEVLGKVAVGKMVRIELYRQEEDSRENTGLLVGVLFNFYGFVLLRSLLWVTPPFLVFLLAWQTGSTWVVPVVFSQVGLLMAVQIVPGVWVGELLKSSAREVGEAVVMLLLLLHVHGRVDDFMTSALAACFWLVHCVVMCGKYVGDKRVKLRENISWVATWLLSWLSSEETRTAWWTAVSRSVANWWRRVFDFGPDPWRTCRDRILTVVFNVFTVATIVVLLSWADRLAHLACRGVWKYGWVDIHQPSDWVAFAFWCVPGLLYALYQCVLKVKYPSWFSEPCQQCFTEDLEPGTVVQRDDCIDRLVDARLLAKEGPAAQDLREEVNEELLERQRWVKAISGTDREDASEGSWSYASLKKLLKRKGMDCFARPDGEAGAEAGTPGDSEPWKVYDRGTVRVFNAKLYVYDIAIILNCTLTGTGGRPVYKRLICTNRAWASDRDLVLDTPLQLDLRELAGEDLGSKWIVCTVQLVGFQGSHLGHTDKHDSVCSLLVDPKTDIYAQLNSCHDQLMRFFSLHGANLFSWQTVPRRILDLLFCGSKHGDAERDDEVHRHRELTWRQCILLGEDTPDRELPGCYGGLLLQELVYPSGKLLHIVLMEEDVRGTKRGQMLLPPLLCTHDVDKHDTDRQPPRVPSPRPVYPKQWSITLERSHSYDRRPWGLAVRKIEGVFELTRDVQSVASDHNFRNPHAKVEVGDRILCIELRDRDEEWRRVDFDQVFPDPTPLHHLAAIKLHMARLSGPTPLSSGGEILL